MYLAKYQHLPDLAAFPINVKFLLYFLCKKKKHMLEKMNHGQSSKLILLLYTLVLRAGS